MHHVPPHMHDSSLATGCIAQTDIQEKNRRVKMVVRTNTLYDQLKRQPYRISKEDSFWDIQAAGTDISEGGLGLQTPQMQTASTFTDAGWDFDNVWAVCQGTNYPRLIWQIPAADFTCPDGVSTEDLLALAQNWLTYHPDAVIPGDANGDHRVNLPDLAILSKQWLKD